ncbi:FtsW/RodA/SpoVE family cell cycle protein [Tissierella sp. MB52-C2]|uniref:FtsW/RodA/SpoVE family cell cycle protein n=1 Tax=Tissierella sp. MB52-C2 TaxID=3070999 RepID=UPI00280B7D00|nr:FtsW/RodA/SpoVE family cell cycle protein [Tissierella sp. MB52-C2]WMM26886.1 FtsW/RodA/SpoVE family cell cycle protein [Tissierella sp. MB52-C2]
MFKKGIRAKSPRNLLFIFEILALFLLFAYEGEKIDRLTLSTGIGLVIIIYLSNYILSKISYGDNYIFLIVTMLISIGVVMIYRIDSSLGIKQLIWISMGIFLFFLTYFVLKYIRGWKNWIYIYIIASYILFFITFVFGSRKGGAINWVSFGGIAFQPAEITKLLAIFILASYYSDTSRWKGIKYSDYYLMGIIYSFILLLFLQRDLGTSLVFYGIFIMIQFIYEEDRRLVLYNIGLFAIGGILGYTLFDHVKIRFQSWLNPWKYIERQGYQITQSLFAIAEGGFFGRGLGLGYPDFIPVVYTDFIFSAICEEMGVFTGIGIIMLFMILVYRGFKIAISQENLFYKILALGISILFGIQSFIILGGVLKMIPLTGLTLPFISYGGSSMLSSFIALGVLQICSEEIKVKEELDEQRD